MTDPSSIVLTGPSGAGKSTVGRILADMTERTFVDMDAELESDLGCTITEYFEEHGEGAFRDRESALCVDLASRAGLVIAAGGGAILRTANREALSCRGILVNLSAPVDTLLRRLDASDDRPLLQGDRRQALLALIEERRAAYGAAAVQVDTDGLSPEQVARRVAGIVGAMEP
ncbi:MAG: shikimate kinase [Deltaproteobacteria bacterium]|nr:shikimate kinase [Deltaproteobacteria bacterium]